MTKQAEYTYNWPRPMVTVDAIIFDITGDRPKVLLIKRGKEPFKGLWAFPGGFVDMEEPLDDAAARELAEETGLKNITLEQFHTFGQPGRDPRGRNITIAYVGFVKDSPISQTAGDDADEARWFDIDNLPKMAFDHNDVAKMAIEKKL